MADIQHQSHRDDGDSDDYLKFFRCHPPVVGNSIRRIRVLNARNFDLTWIHIFAKIP